MGEIVFPAPVKQELEESLENIISTHSPTCQLRIQIMDMYTVKNSVADNLTPELDWSLDVKPSTSSGSQKSTVLSSQDDTAMMPCSVLSSSQDVTYLPDLNENSSQEIMMHGLSASVGSIPPNTTNVTSNTTGSAISSQELTHKQAPMLHSESSSPVNYEDTGHNPNPNTNRSQELMTPNEQSVMSGTDTTMPKHSQEVTSTLISQELTASQRSLNIDSDSIVYSIKHTLNQMDNSTDVKSKHQTSQELTQDDMFPDNMSDSSGTVILHQDCPDMTTQQNENTNISSTTPRITRIQNHLSSIGLPPEVFNTNKDKYFLAESIDDNDIDCLHFTDIMDRSCSVTLANLTHEDISFEKEQLKMSSPILSSNTQTEDTNEDTDSVKQDPTYGQCKPVRQSMRPRRAPSASQIAAQKKIKLTKGYKPPMSKKSTPPLSVGRNVSPAKVVSPPMASNDRKKTKAGKTNVADDSLPLIKVKAKSVTVTHHGLKKHKSLQKGRHCVCSMCGDKFPTSTSFIKHYSETHPPLACTDCQKVFSNPLSLQKHKYHHTSQQLKYTKLQPHFSL